MPNTKRTDILIGGRRLRRSGARHRAQAGARRRFSVTWSIRRSAAPRRRRACLRDRGRGAPAVRDHRRLGRVADGAQPILDMVVTNSKLHDAMRPTYLTFGGEVAAGRALRAHDRERPAARRPGRAGAGGRRRTARRGGTGFDDGRERIDVPLGGGDTIAARLLVAADGARSAIREAAGIASMAGATISPASSPRSSMSAIITAGPKSISCPPVRSRSCR